MANKLLDKIKKNSTIKETAILADSQFFNKKDMITTEIPVLNVALSSELDGGFSPGLTLWAGPSKHFKTAFLLIMLRAYQKKYPDGICLFYDSEFGTGKTYFDAFSIDMTRVVHTPLTNIEQMKFDIMAQLEQVERGDKLFIAVDSVGNLASKKEVKDALEQKSVEDMSRAKQIKSLFRMVTPHLNLKDIPMHVVMHTYMEQGMYPKAIVSGGCLEAGTKIRLADGRVKCVEDITTDDVVVTMLGPQQVSKTWTPKTLFEGQPECYEVEFDDGSVVRCSAEHAFFVDGDWVEAQDLTSGVEVLAV